MRRRIVVKIGTAAMDATLTAVIFVGLVRVLIWLWYAL